MELKTGDILNCTGKKLLSKIIKMFTKSRFSHTAIFIEIWGGKVHHGRTKRRDSVETL